MATEIVAAAAAQDIDDSKLSGRGPYIPDSAEGLQEVFIHLWTRLNEANFIARAIGLYEPGSDAHAVALSALEQVTNVDLAYSHMLRVTRNAQGTQA
jgi:hypothetical protein